MKKCDVCGKTALLPEYFGKSVICKHCFIKAKGLFWKKQYDKLTDVEQHRSKALDAARKQNFPEPVMASIDSFFTMQTSTMQPCSCCGQQVRSLHILESVSVCSTCYDEINIDAWKEVEYDDNESVENNRKKVLKIASKRHFPPNIINEIHMHFDKNLQKGLVCTIDGHAGQKLKVFTNYCILTTDSSRFDIEDVSIFYAKASRPKEAFLSNSTAKALAQGLLSGGIVKAGVNLAKSSAISAAIDKYAPEKASIKVINGNYKINYLTYSYADYQKANDNDYGFIRFVNSKTNRQSDEVLFFFRSDSSKINSAYKAICDGMDAVTQAASQQVYSQPQVLQPIIQSSSAADEILKFKQLLDIGAITHEEYNAKKKSLLEL